MVLDRYLPALRRVAREHDGQTVAIFSHGAALRIVLGALQGLSLADIGQTSHGDNTAVSLIEADGDELRVVFRDDNSHLTGQEGLSTFGKQTWWKTKGMVEPGQLYRPASHEQCRLFGAPESGQSTAVCTTARSSSACSRPSGSRTPCASPGTVWTPCGGAAARASRLWADHPAGAASGSGAPAADLYRREPAPLLAASGFYGDGPELEKSIRLQIPNLREWVME